jgi:NAD(P)-dependent dehydrogenase (short-subunit alcohol dehydrogenase family)
MSLVALVTGGTGLIGTEIVRQLSAKGRFRVVIGCRDEQKGAKTVASISASTKSSAVSYELVDTSNHASIKALAGRWQGPLHVLVNCASIAPPRRQQTPDGIELQFATNVLGYFWMITEFSDILKQSAPSRIVNVASAYAGNLNLDDPQFKKRAYNNKSAYRASKQAERMLTVAFADRLKAARISVNACHPGECNSKLCNDLGFRGHETAAQGAGTPVMLAVEEIGATETGKWFQARRRGKCQFAGDAAEIQKLFDYCASFP